MTLMIKTVLRKKKTGLLLFCVRERKPDLTIITGGNQPAWSKVMSWFNNRLLKFVAS